MLFLLSLFFPVATVQPQAEQTASPKVTYSIKLVEESKAIHVISLTRHRSGFPITEEARWISYIAAAVMFRGCTVCAQILPMMLSQALHMYGPTLICTLYIRECF